MIFLSISENEILFFGLSVLPIFLILLGISAGVYNYVKRIDRHLRVVIDLLSTIDENIGEDRKKIFTILKKTDL